MAINVLQYNALARSTDAKKDQIGEQRRLRDSADSACAGIPALITEQAGIIAGYDSDIDSAQAWQPGGGTGIGGQAVEGRRAAFLFRVNDCCGWENLPCFTDMGPSGCAGQLCVWDTACVDFNYGKCCLWTVPSGTTKVMFEIWGPGGAAGAGVCCGGHPFGQTGAFAQTFINVVAGNQFTVCAGCAIKYCSYCSQSCISQSCPSFICASGLQGANECFCMCAQGGIHNLCCEMTDRTRVVCGGIVCATSCDGRYHYWGTCACICSSGSNYCGQTMEVCRSNLDNNNVPTIPGSGTCSYLSVSTGAIKVCGTGALDYFVQGQWSGGCINDANCGRWCTPGVPRFGCNCCICFQNYCCGYQRRAACGCNCVVGMGGMPSNVCGGATGIYGDYGRQGGVRITYC